MLFSTKNWNQFCKKTEEKYKLKTYPHFDPYFDFPKQKDKIQKLVCSKSGLLVAQHPFLPLVKILQKTPRYRYQENEEKYDLETKVRPISFASHFDTYLYGFYSFTINEIYQNYIRSNGFDSCILAYRTDLNGKCNIQFAKEVFDIIKKSRPGCTAIALVISPVAPAVVPMSLDPITTARLISLASNNPAVITTS